MENNQQLYCTGKAVSQYTLQEIYELILNHYPRLRHREQKIELARRIGIIKPEDNLKEFYLMAIDAAKDFGKKHTIKRRAAEKHKIRAKRSLFFQWTVHAYFGVARGH